MYGDLQLEYSSTVERAADEIRRALFAGRLEPGTPLREVALSEAMGVGRSTIREALAVLVADGVAVRVPNKGVAVKELSAADVGDLSRARVALESAGVRRWTEATPEQRAAVHEAAEAYTRLAATTGDTAALTEAHLRIHRALVGLTGSRRLLAAADVYNAELRLGLAHLDRVRGNIAEQVEDHRLLVGLLEAGRVEEAAVELDRHLAAAEVSLRDAIGHGTIER
ncbi:MAG: GntR family transcriptional regulator [Nocardioidaceae bacterium]